MKRLFIYYENEKSALNSFLKKKDNLRGINSINDIDYIVTSADEIYFIKEISNGVIYQNECKVLNETNEYLESKINYSFFTSWFDKEYTNNPSLFSKEVLEIYQKLLSKFHGKVLLIGVSKDLCEKLLIPFTNIINKSTYKYKSLTGEDIDLLKENKTSDKYQDLDVIDNTCDKHWDGA